jgi:hypothetical protein
LRSYRCCGCFVVMYFFHYAKKTHSLKQRPFWLRSQQATVRFVMSACPLSARPSRLPLEAFSCQFILRIFAKSLSIQCNFFKKSDKNRQFYVNLFYWFGHYASPWLLTLPSTLVFVRLLVHAPPIVVCNGVRRAPVGPSSELS